MDATDSLIALHVARAKAKAQAHRWEEEVVLLNKEMCRTQLESCLVGESDHPAGTSPTIRWAACRWFVSICLQQAALECEILDK